MRHLQDKLELVSALYIIIRCNFEALLKHSVLILLLALTCGSFAQGKQTFYGKLVTRISITGASADTARLLFCRNVDDNKLTVYNVADGVVSSATAYYLSDSKEDLYLNSKSIDQRTTDSLLIEFKDFGNTVIIGKHDRYILFPKAYAQLKDEVLHKHHITALITFLNDSIGDYPIADALLLFDFTPLVSKQISRAYVVTQRSQSDLTDHWTCTYKYNRQGLLEQLIVKAGTAIRYTKKVQYKTLKTSLIRTYLNIESRQTTDRTIRYFPGNKNLVKFQDDTYETGKDRETKTSVTLTAKNIGGLKSIEPSFSEVLVLVNSKRN